MTIGARLKAAREARGVTQTQLGKVCGVTKQTIFKYETGLISNIPMDNMERMSGYLGVEPAYLLGWLEDSPGASPTPLSHPATKKVPRLSGGETKGGKLRQQQVEGYDAAPSDLDCNYSLLCQDESMAGAGLRAGDVVYIRAQGEKLLKDGDLVAATLDGGPVLLRRFRRTDDAIILLAEHSGWDPLVLTGRTRARVSVIGVVVGFTHKF